jgi:hypothetical protein
MGSRIMFQSPLPFRPNRQAALFTSLQKQETALGDEMDLSTPLAINAKIWEGKYSGK